MKWHWHVDVPLSLCHLVLQKSQGYPQTYEADFKGREEGLWRTEGSEKKQDILFSLVKARLHSVR